VPRAPSLPTPLLGKQGAWPPPRWHGQVWGISASFMAGWDNEGAPVFLKEANNIPFPQQAVTGVTAYV